MNMHVSHLVNRIKAHPLHQQAGVPLLYFGLIVVLLVTLDVNPKLQQTVSSSAIVNSSVNDTQLNQLATWPLFGKTEGTVGIVKDANLSLIGIIFEGKQSQAIIRVNGVEQIFKVDSNINGIYKITKIEPMQVIVTSTNGLEKLELFEDIVSTNKASTNASIPAPQVSPKTLPIKGNKGHRHE